LAYLHPRFQGQEPPGFPGRFIKHTEVTDDGFEPVQVAGCTDHGETVWVRPHRDQVVNVHVGDDGPVEVARHARTTPGNPRVADAHFPPQPQGPPGRTPRAKTVAEERFLALGDGAVLWLTEAAAAGCSRIRVKMAEAVDLAALHDGAAVDRALGRPRPRAASGSATEADPVTTVVVSRSSV
jgi:hypothetical protein